jgi:hypothetical protein
MSHAVHVPSIEREIGECGVAGEEALYPALAQAPLATDEERRIVIGPSTEVAAENRHETPKQRLLSRITFFHPPDPDGAALEVDVLSLNRQASETRSP